jgi:hypothetical protein
MFAAGTKEGGPSPDHTDYDTGAASSAPEGGPPGRGPGRGFGRRKKKRKGHRDHRGSIKGGWDVVDEETQNQMNKKRGQRGSRKWRRVSEG